jgi:hypothetical protein
MPRPVSRRSKKPPNQRDRVAALLAAFRYIGRTDSTFIEHMAVLSEVILFTLPDARPAEIAVAADHAYLTSISASLH